jgi:recombination protein RecT
MTKTANTEQLKNRIAQQEIKEQQPQQPQQQTGVSPYRKVEAYLSAMTPQLEQALPKTGITAERLSRLTLTTIRLNPTLLEADLQSLLGAVMQSAQLGLEPNLLGSCYFIPYKDKNSGITTVSFQIGYRGLIDLVSRTGEVLTIVANPVYTNDEFYYEYGLNEQLKHVPVRGERGDLEYFYAYAKLRNGGHAFVVMSIEEINKIRDQHSINYKFKKNNSLWAKHYEAMAKKTVIKQLVKYLPISVEVLNDIAHDETVRKDITEEARHIDPAEIEAPAEEEQAIDIDTENDSETPS